MSVRMRHTSSHSKNRRSHHALADRVVLKDKETGAISLPHRLDETTGMYRGKVIVPVKVKAKKDSLLSKIKLPKKEVETGAVEVEAVEEKETKKVPAAKKAAAAKTKIPAGVKKHDKD